MLTQLLCNFSEEELLNLIPKNTLEFVSSIEFDSTKPESKSSNKANKAALIASLKSIDFVTNADLRNRLIERMTSVQLTELFPSVVGPKTYVNSKDYDRVMAWASENLSVFSVVVGLSPLNLIKNDKPLKNIKRIEPSYALYPYQENIRNDVFDFFGKGEKRLLIHLPTGAGKTRTAINIACEHLKQNSKNVVLWLADREELCTQAFDEFVKAWSFIGSRSITAYGFYSNSNESLGGIDSGFVVAGLYKFLALRKKDSNKLKILYKELADKVTLVIFDEAHKSIAPEFRKVIEDFISHDSFHGNLIGLTATPGRSYSQDGLSEEDSKLAQFFNNKKLTMKTPGYISPIDFLVHEGYLAKANFRSLNYDQSDISAYELRDCGGEETMRALANNVERNKKIIKTIIDEVSKGSSIIVFACNVEHSSNIATALNYFGVKAASIDSKSDSIESRRFKINQYKNGELKVLVNYNVLTAGFDAPKTNVTIIAKPMNSLVQYLQMAGRAMRGPRSGGNAECYIYTVMDDIPEFQSINLAFDYWNNMWVDKEITE